MENRGDGEYEVVFNRDVSKCAINVTVRGAQIGFATVTSVVGEAIRVRTREEKGQQEDEPFSVAVFC